MLQGTGSDVGKSLLVAGLCRAYARRGLEVRPFKPQNMSNNAAVTADGGEIGRAQALQARACGVPPSVHMNPVLLKPQSEVGAQVVVQGRMAGSADARAYARLKSTLLPAALDSFRRLAAEADLVLVEGAGSPAEVNLREGDIANMGFAEAADLPVVLVGDIDRGGVIAAIVGTHALLTQPERARLKGYVINKFRGDATLFEPAPTIIRERTGLDCLGIVPWFAAARRLPAEDAVALDALTDVNGTGDHGVDGGRRIRVVVPRLPRIANFDDLDPLRAEADVAVIMVAPGEPLPPADLILLPGSKATLADLEALREAGWDTDIRRHVRRGGRVLGLCGGYQILGTRIADPDGIEGPPAEAAGLGLLAVDTVLTGAKSLHEVEGREAWTGKRVRGYEMHIGATTGADAARPMLRLDAAGNTRGDGAVSVDGLVEGCYVHGIFADDAFRAAYLARLRPGRPASGLDYNAGIETTLDALADHLAHALDLDRILRIARA
ncbi:MAG: cobyric acid synthase [Alphaproteobacteria bacterium]|nr:cobyric acid synthase [Alphaproteobacteria bacterium]